LAELHVQRRHPTSRIRCSEILKLVQDLDVQRWRWQCECTLDTPIPFGNTQFIRRTVRGTFGLTFDRFGRVRRMCDLAVEVE